MTRDAFWRAIRVVALAAACLAFAVVLELLRRELGWGAAPVVVAAAVLALLATLERIPDPERTPTALSRRQIEARREAARLDSEDA